MGGSIYTCSIIVEELLRRKTALLYTGITDVNMMEK